MGRQRFSIATFNVRNLVNAETNYYQKKDGSWNRYSQTAFDRKIDWLANQLIAMDADHVCLQEVFHLAALQKLADRYHELVIARGIEQAPYTEVIHFGNDRGTAADPSPGLAYLGRQPVVQSREVQDLSADPITLGDEFGLNYSLSATSRPLTMVQVDLGGGVTGWIVNAHLKSKRPLLDRDSPADEPKNMLFLERAKGAIGSLILRAGEALALRRELLDMMRENDVPVFVVGDFNDDGSAVTTEVIRGEAPWRHESDKAIKRGFWDVELYSAAKVHLRRSEKADFTTHIFNGHHGMIDHIFLSEQFYYRNRERLGDLDYVRAFNDHVIDKDFRGAPREDNASDHGQLVAYFSFETPDDGQVISSSH